MHIYLEREQEEESRLFSARPWLSLLNINNFTEHQHGKRLLCDHNEADTRQLHSHVGAQKIKTKNRQTQSVTTMKNQTIKMIKHRIPPATSVTTVSLPNGILASTCSPCIPHKTY